MDEIITMSLNDGGLDRALLEGYESLFGPELTPFVNLDRVPGVKALMRANAKRAVEEYRGNPEALLYFIRNSSVRSMAAGLASGAYLTLTGEMGPVMDCFWGGLGVEYTDDRMDLEAFLNDVEMPAIRGPKFCFAEVGGIAFTGRKIRGDPDSYCGALNFSDLYGLACMFARTKGAIKCAVLHDYAGLRSRNIGSLDSAVLLDHALADSKNRRSLNNCRASGRAGRSSRNIDCLAGAKITEMAFAGARFDKRSLRGAKHTQSIFCGTDRFNRRADKAFDILFAPVLRSHDYLADRLGAIIKYLSGGEDKQEG